MIFTLLQRSKKRSPGGKASRMAIFLAILAIWPASRSVFAQVSLSNRIHTLVSGNPEEFGHFGLSVGSVQGDVDGDGRHDLLVGAWLEDGGAREAGRAYVYSGQSGSLLFSLESPNPELRGSFGRVVAPAGYNIASGSADLVADFAVSAWFEDGGAENAGRVYVFNGSSGTVLRTLESPTAEKNGLFGNAVICPGDLSGDGIADLVVSARMEDAGGRMDAGKVHAFSGADGSLLWSTQSLNPETSGWFGASLAPTYSDITADGTPDILVGATGENCGARDAGCVYLINGTDGAIARRYSSPNPQVNGAFGTAIDGIELDLDDNGRYDFVVGAPQETESLPNDGRAYIMSMETASEIEKLVSPNPQSATYFGSSVSSLPLSNAATSIEKFAIVVGVPGENASLTNSGKVYMFLSDDASTVKFLNSPNPKVDGRFGWPVVSIRDDVNGDGVNDLLVGAPREGSFTTRPTGRAYVMDPSPNFLPVDTSILASDSLRIGQLDFWSTLFPNPSNGMIYLDLDLEADGQVQVFLIDLAGRTSKVEQQMLSSGFHRLPIDLSAFPTGPYAIRIQQENQIKTLDLMLIR